MDKAENAMVTITKERYDFHIAEIERLREELRVSRQSTTILIESLDGDIERLREALQNIADGPRDVEKSYVSLLHEVQSEARAAIAKATGSE